MFLFALLFFFSASKAVPICLNITQEQLEMPVWHQIQNNGFLDPGDFEIRYASTVDDMSNLSLEDNFSDEENELQGIYLQNNFLNFQRKNMRQLRRARKKIRNLIY